MRPAFYLDLLLSTGRDRLSTDVLMTFLFYSLSGMSRIVPIKILF